MRRMMNRMGVDMKAIPDVKEVLIRTESKEIVITQPVVQEMEADESTTFVVMAKGYEERELEQPSYSEEDVEILCMKTGVNRDVAIAALVDSDGEIGTALLKLQPTS